MKQLLDTASTGPEMLPTSATAYLPPYTVKGTSSSYYHTQPLTGSQSGGECITNRCLQVQLLNDSRHHHHLHHQVPSLFSPAVGNHMGMQMQSQQQHHNHHHHHQQRCSGINSNHGETSLPLHLQSPAGGFSPPSTPLFQPNKVVVSTLRGGSGAAAPGDGYGVRLTDFTTGTGSMPYDVQSSYHPQQQLNGYMPSTNGSSAFQRLSPWSAQAPCGGPYFNLDPCKYRILRSLLQQSSLKKNTNEP